MTERESLIQSPYEKAAARWVAKQTGLEAENISGVTFAVIHGGYCETCAYDATGVEFKHKGKLENYEFPYGVTAASFLEEAVELMKEAE